MSTGVTWLHGLTLGIQGVGGGLECDSGLASLVEQVIQMDGQADEGVEIDRVVAACQLHL